MRAPIFRRAAVASLASLLLAAGAPHADGAPPNPVGAREDGAEAPAGCWTAVGGCPARTAAAATPPVEGPVVVAWEQAVKGEIECEPLVWGRTVLVASRDKDDMRWLTALSLADGKVVGRKGWRGAPPLLPAAWNGTVVVRAGAARIEALRVRADGLVAVGAIDTAEPVHELLFFRREIYARVGDRVSRYDLGKKTPTWTVGERCRGRLALRGESVFGTDYDRAGNAYLCSWKRADGKASRTLMGHHGGRVPEPDAARPDVQVFEREAFVLHDIGIVASGGGTANLAVAPRVAMGGASFLGEARLRDAVGEAAAASEGWIGAMKSESGAPELWLSTAENRHWTLATMDAQPQFASPRVPPSVGGGFAYLGATGVELATRRIAWSVPETPLFRPVPADGAVLLVVPGGKVKALRGPRPADVGATVFAQAGDAAVQGRVALRDGGVVVGALRVKPDGAVFVDASQPRTIAAADVAFAEDASGTPLVAAHEGAVDGLDDLASRDTAQAYAALAVQAIATRDPALIERLVAEASTRGAEPKDLSRAESYLKELAGRGKAPAVNDAEWAKVSAAERGVAATGARVFWERCRRLPETAPRKLVLDLLEGALGRDPTHAEAAARVRSMLPPGVEPPPPFDAGDWISFLRALEVTPVTIVKPRPPDAPDLSPGERTYGMYLKVWRPDLVAVQSRQLLIVSAPVKPGRIANCLSAGELVCDALESIFATGKRVRDKRWPMTILLFENREEYLKVLGKRAGDAEEKRMLEWSAGQYSPGDGATLYLPEDEAGFRRVMRTFVHELTHQWLAERCPLYASGEGVAVQKSSGHFVVEGFAEMVEELEFDVARRTWRFDPACPSLDSISSLPAATLFPWKEFFAFDHRGFEGLSHDNDIPLRRRRVLEGERKMSRGHLYYEQAAATCHCLFQADGGKLRQALLEYVAAYYAGRPPAVAKAFGMTDEELGRRVIEFARAPAAK